MIKYIIGILSGILLLTGCNTQPDEPSTQSYAAIDDVLGIDEDIVFYRYPVEAGCGVEEDTYNAFYCPIDDTIYIGIDLRDSLTYAQYVLVLAHEDGHSEDYATEETFYNEQYADCYAGGKLAELYTAAILDNTDIIEIHDWFYALPPGGDHGTSDQRWGAFYDGFTGGDCYDYHRH